MKMLVVLLVFAFVQASFQEQTFSGVLNQWLALLESNRITCIEKTGVNPKLANRVLRYGEFVEDPALKCYLGCIFYKENAINDARELQLEVLSKKLDIKDPAVLQEVSKKCINLKSDDVCAKVFYVGKCIYETCKLLLKP